MGTKRRVLSSFKTEAIYLSIHNLIVVSPETCLRSPFVDMLRLFLRNICSMFNERVFARSRYIVMLKKFRLAYVYEVAMLVC